MRLGGGVGVRAAAAVRRKPRRDPAHRGRIRGRGDEFFHGRGEHHGVFRTDLEHEVSTAPAGVQVVGGELGEVGERVRSAVFRVDRGEQGASDADGDHEGGGEQPCRGGPLGDVVRTLLVQAGRLGRSRTGARRLRCRGRCRGSYGLLPPGRAR